MACPCSRSRYCCIAVVLSLAAALPAGGCKALFFTPLYILKGNDIPAAYAGLEEKRVVVVCRPVASLTYANPSVAANLARQVGTVLKDNVPKIKLIDQREVAAWTDNNTWQQYAEIGEALKADMVVGIDLLDFSIFQGQTLYQGKANVTVNVHDCTDGGKLAFEKALPQVVYPRNSGIETSRKLEPEFRRKFVRVLADHIGRCFYAYDRYADYALDATALE